MHGLSQLIHLDAGIKKNAYFFVKFLDLKDTFIIYACDNMVHKVCLRLWLLAACILHHEWYNMYTCLISKRKKLV